MNIKTFPLQMTKSYHQKLKKAAEEKGMTIKDYIFEAIDEKMEG